MIADDDLWRFLWPHCGQSNLTNQRKVEPGKVTVEEIAANTSERRAGSATRYRILGRSARTLAETWHLVPVNEKVPFAGHRFPWRT